MQTKTEEREIGIAQGATPLQFALDVSRAFVNKDGAKQSYRFHTSFVTETHTLESFLELVRAGYAYTAPFAKISPEVTGAAVRGVLTPHHTENWLESQIITLDDDSRAQGVVAKWWGDDWFGRYGFAFAESSSSVAFTAEKGHPIIILDQPITDPALYKECLKAACAYWPEVDQLHDITRSFYNAQNARVHMLGNVCPWDVFVRDILEPYRMAQAVMAQAKAVQRVTGGAAAAVASGDRIERYLLARFNGALGLLERTTAGQNRHKRLLWFGQFVGAIEATDWARAHLHILGDVEGAAVSACTTNGYLDDHCHGRAEGVYRTLAAGRAIPFAPLDMPLDGLASSQLPTLCIPFISTKGGEFCPSTVILGENEHLGDVLTLEQLPARCILDAPTGTGKSTLATNGKQVILAVSTTIAAEQLYQSGGGRVGILHGTSEDISLAHDVIVTTYDSLPRLMASFTFIDPPNWSLVIDEQHNIALADYRAKATQKMLAIATAEPWGRVVLMSGTPLDMPNGGDYERVTVRRAEQRRQPAQRVLYSSGQRLAAVANIAAKHVKGGERVLVYLESKGGELLTLTAELEAAGVTGVYHLNSDNKLEQAGRAIVDTQKLPTDCNVLITTAVLVESTNLLSEIGAAVIASPIHPAYAHQFVSRARLNAPMCYILNNGDGAGYGLDIQAELATVWETARLLAYQANMLGRPWDNQRGKALAGTLGRLIAIDENGAAVPSELGVLHHVTESQANYAWGNPTAFQRFTEQYGWSWAETADLSEVQSTGEAKAAAAVLKEQAADRWGDVVRELHQRGELKTRLTKGLEGAQRRAAEQGLFIYDQLTEQGVSSSWDVACALMATGRDSGHWFKRMRRTVALWGMGEDGVIQAIRAAVPLGVSLDREQRYKIVLDAFAADDQMTLFTHKGRRRSWESERPIMTEQAADELLESLFNVTKKKAEGGGRYWIVTGDADILQRAAAGFDVLKGVTNVEK